MSLGDITLLNRAYPWNNIDGVCLDDALALGHGEISEVTRAANSGIGETMWIARGLLRVTGRKLLPDYLVILNVELVGEPTVRSRLNPYTNDMPEWGEPRAEHVVEARILLTRNIGFIMTGAVA